ncbi:CUGBP Elav-like member 2 [Datura stramonium]|uniref:CUGBP Elav-like member 2 n=1 Tax=Datura stramonium TaxID=4076 RepID=A0ABS8UZK7_DATST|nr:CUGBP Elav-like member 2 [Datura stramonium]
MEISAKNDGRFPVETRLFQLHLLVTEASCLVKMFLLCLIRDLHVVLADDGDVNKTGNQKAARKLGCLVTAVSTGFQCLSALGHSLTTFQVVSLDLQMPEV